MKELIKTYTSYLNEDRIGIATGDDAGDANLQSLYKRFITNANVPFSKEDVDINLMGYITKLFRTGTLNKSKFEFLLGKLNQGGYFAVIKILKKMISDPAAQERLEWSRIMVMRNKNVFKATDEEDAATKTDSGFGDQNQAGKDSGSPKNIFSNTGRSAKVHNLVGQFLNSY